MTVYQVVLSEEYEDLAKQIEEISNKKRQSISKTIRDMICDMTGFEPVFERNIVRSKKV